MVIGAYSCHRQAEDRRDREAVRHSQREERLRNPAGQDDAARQQSRIQGGVVASPTGKRFFLGQLCSDDCSGHIAGYRWATNLGITKESACDSAYDSSNSWSFYEGCVHGVKDVIASFEPDW